MLTREEDVDTHALRRRAWTISAIARHLGQDRKTIRAYLEGERVAGRVDDPPGQLVTSFPAGAAVAAAAVAAAGS